MLIYFCDRCGHLLSRAGQALPKPLNAESAWKVCADCHGKPMPVPAAQATSAAPEISKRETSEVPPVARRPTEGHAKPNRQTTIRRSGIAGQAAHADGRHGHTPAPEAGPNLAVMGAVAAGVVVLGLGMYLALKSKPKPVPQEEPPKVVRADPKPDPDAMDAKPKTPVVTTVANPKPADPKPADTKTTAQPEPDRPTPPPVADSGMGNFRDNRAAKLLEEIKAWHTQNPADPWTYQSRLKDLAGMYGSAPAAGEARKLLEELKTLPPPPDRLDTAAPESKDYKLVYDIDLSNPRGFVVDNRAQVKNGFDRIAYFMELQIGNAEVQYLYVSMDAFTDDVNKIGVPQTSTGAFFQQNVANMNVFSNASGIVSGSGLSGGNIEFWSGNYGGRNAANVPNASNEVYDFGDEGNKGEGYGCMQVHNHDAKQTLFVLNHWTSGTPDIGIGNQSGGNPDWTFSNNSGAYRMKRLRVLVHLK